MITRILIPIDDHHGSEMAIPVAGALARLTGATVELVSIDPAGMAPDRTRQRLDEVVPLVPPGVAVATTIETTTVSVATSLAHLERDAGAVICLATHGRGALLSLALGSVTAGLVRHSDLPVLVVGPACTAHGPSDLTVPAVVALDGGASDDDVLQAAALWQRATGAPLAITTVVTRPSEPDAWAEADAVLAWAEQRAHELDLTMTTSLVAAGDAEAGILRAIDDRPGCLIVGSHRRGALGRMVFGSTVKALAHRAACPVLVAAPQHERLVGAGPATIGLRS